MIEAGERRQTAMFMCWHQNFLCFYLRIVRSATTRPMLTTGKANIRGHGGMDECTLVHVGCGGSEY